MSIVYIPTQNDYVAHMCATCDHLIDMARFDNLVVRCSKCKRFTHYHHRAKSCAKCGHKFGSSVKPGALTSRRTHDSQRPERLDQLTNRSQQSTIRSAKYGWLDPSHIRDASLSRKIADARAASVAEARAVIAECAQKGLPLTLCNNRRESAMFRARESMPDSFDDTWKACVFYDPEEWMAQGYVVDRDEAQRMVKHLYRGHFENSKDYRMCLDRLNAVV